MSGSVILIFEHEISAESKGGRSQSIEKLGFQFLRLGSRFPAQA